MISVIRAQDTALRNRAAVLLWRMAQSRELTEISFLSSALSLFLVLRDKKFTEDRDGSGLSTSTSHMTRRGGPGHWGACRSVRG